MLFIPCQKFISRSSVFFFFFFKISLGNKMPLYKFKIYYFDRCSKILYYILRHKKCLNVEA